MTPAVWPAGGGGVWEGAGWDRASQTCVAAAASICCQLGCCWACAQGCGLLPWAPVVPWGMGAGATSLACVIASQVLEAAQGSS